MCNKVVAVIKDHKSTSCKSAIKGGGKKSCVIKLIAFNMSSTMD